MRQKRRVSTKTSSHSTSSEPMNRDEYLREVARYIRELPVIEKGKSAFVKELPIVVADSFVDRLEDIAGEIE